MTQTMTVQQAHDRRADGRRRALDVRRTLDRQLEDRRSLGISPNVREYMGPEPLLPVHDLRDAKPLRCPKCDKVAHLDKLSVIQSYGRRALWICSDGHDGIVRLITGLETTDRAIARYERSPKTGRTPPAILPCAGCQGFVEPKTYRVFCRECIVQGRHRLRPTMRGPDWSPDKTATQRKSRQRRRAASAGA